MNIDTLKTIMEVVLGVVIFFALSKVGITLFNRRIEEMIEREDQLLDLYRFAVKHGVDITKIRIDLDDSNTVGEDGVIDESEIVISGIKLTYVKDAFGDTSPSNTEFRGYYQIRERLSFKYGKEHELDNKESHKRLVDFQDKIVREFIEKYNVE